MKHIKLIALAAFLFTAGFAYAAGSHAVRVDPNDCWDNPAMEGEKILDSDNCPGPSEDPCCYNEVGTHYFDLGR